MVGIEDWPRPERTARFHEVVEIVDQLLRNEVTTYQGRYYQLKDAVMQPRPIQEPRPPITIAAHGPVMLKIAARHADAWNICFYGGSGSADKMLELTRQHNSLLEDYCTKIGRDPLTLRRSLFFAPQKLETAYGSVDAFENDVGCFGDAGIDEFIFPYPLKDEQFPVFERIANDAIPKLRG